MKGPMEGIKFSPHPPGGGLEKKKNLEELAGIGYAYRSFVDDVVNGTVKEKLDSGISDQWYQKFKKVTEPMLTKNKQFFEMNNLDKVKLLGQVKSLKDKMSIVEDLKDFIVMDEKVPGFFVLTIDRILFKQLRTGAQAFAFTGEGVPFIAIQSISGTEYETFNKNQYNTNLPHEFSHLVWKEVQQNALIENTEEAEDLYEAFSMYRNEVVARISGGQNAGGYASPPQEDFRAEKDHWFMQDHITKWVGELNGLLMENINPLLRYLKLSPDPILGMCLMSKNFTELRASFVELHERLEKAAANVTPPKEDNPDDISSCVIEV